MRRLLLAAAVILAGAGGVRAALAQDGQAALGPLTMRHKWVYVQTNLLVDKNVDELAALMARSAKAGYNGIMLADSKFGRLADMDRRYFANVDRVKAAARQLKLDLIPCIFPVGYSNSILSQDVNLAAGLPVRDAPFVVRNGRLTPDDPLALRGGGFEQADARGRLAGWDWQDKTVHLTRATVHGGHAAVEMSDIARLEPQHGHARLCQTLDVQPFRYYRLSVWIKTKEFETPGEVRVQVLADGAPGTLVYQDLGVKRTQDWTEHDVAFNTLGHDKVRVYLGVWGGRGGTIWWDDARLEPGGFVNVLRRSGCPLRLTSPDGRTVYVEGRDYAKVADPLLGARPWRGEYDAWHQPSAVAAPAGSRLREGDRALASYYHPAIIGHGQVSCTLDEPRLYELLADQMKRMDAAFGPAAAGYMMSHDEIRTGGWDALAAAKGWSAGRWLAFNVAECQRIARRVRPGAPLYVWSDMFDPNHNARADYYLVRGDLAGSWEGLGRDTVVVNWYFGKRERGLAWFAEHGHRQVIAGYYDGRPEQIVEWLKSARQVRGVVGVMYTTWQRKYDDLERFSRSVDEFMRGQPGGP